MKRIKKVSASQLMSNTGTIINSMSSGDDPTLNAPSISAVKGYVDNYSTTEKIIGTWTNGKPLYRRVLTGTKVSGTDLSLSVGSNLDKATKIVGIMKNRYVMPFYESSTVYVRIEFYDNDGIIKIKSGTSSYSNGDVIVIVEYTKTTD